MLDHFTKKCGRTMFRALRKPVEQAVQEWQKQTRITQTLLELILTELASNKQLTIEVDRKNGKLIITNPNPYGPITFLGVPIDQEPFHIDLLVEEG